VIGRAGVGLDNVDYKHAEKAGIVVSFTPDQNAISVAEICDRHDAVAGAIHSRRPTRIRRKATGIGSALWVRNSTAKRSASWARGRFGYLTARRAMAFGMKVLAYDPFLSRDKYFAERSARPSWWKLDELLARADVVSCHLPSTAQTVGLLNRERFMSMKPGAFFISILRAAKWLWSRNWWRR